MGSLRFFFVSLKCHDLKRRIYRRIQHITDTNLSFAVFVYSFFVLVERGALCRISRFYRITYHVLHIIFNLDIDARKKKKNQEEKLVFMSRDYFSSKEYVIYIYIYNR